MDRAEQRSSHNNQREQMLNAFSVSFPLSSSTSAPPPPSPHTPTHTHTPTHNNASISALLSPVNSYPSSSSPAPYSTYFFPPHHQQQHQHQQHQQQHQQHQQQHQHLPPTSAILPPISEKHGGGGIYSPSSSINDNNNNINNTITTSTTISTTTTTAMVTQTPPVFVHNPVPSLPDPPTKGHTISLKTQENLLGMHTFSYKQIQEWMQALCKKQVKAIQDYQHQQLPGVDIHNLVEQHKLCLGYIFTQQKMLTNLFNTAILSPAHIHSVLTLREELQFYVYQLELFKLELTDMQKENSTSSAPIASLIIRKQPFPFVMMNGKQLGDEDMQVQLLTGAAASLARQKEGNAHPYIVQASLLGDRPHQTTKGPLLENTTQVMNEKGIARFPLRFPVGTHRSVVNIKFVLPLSQSTTIESKVSNPFIILTNESQWSECFGALVKRDVFQEKLTVTWPFFANTLQQHFLAATRYEMPQETSISSRPQLFPSKVSELSLKGQSVGTFLIRFAESPPGRFDIVFVGYEKIKHYLVKDEDIRGAKKTFPDFLLESAPLLNLLRLSTHTNTDMPSFTTVPKGVILHPYLSPQKPELFPDGYQQLSL